MIRTRHLTTPNETHQLNFWKTGLIAMLVMLVFGFFPSVSKLNQTSEPNIVAEEKNAATITSPSDFPNIKIKNFGQMDEHFYRGAQPKPDDYRALATLGIKTIIDLRDDPTS